MVRVVDQDQKALTKKHGIKIMSEFSAKNQNQKVNDFRIVFIRCDCDSEVLAARYDSEFDMLDLCIYETKSSFSHKMTLWQKLQYIYQLLRYGQPYTDQMILQREQIEELKAFLCSL